MSDAVLREQLANFLKGHEAHMDFLDMVKDFPEEHMNDVFSNGRYTFWHLLEHIRFTQKDILDFMVESVYKEPKWPKDYWPENSAKASKKDWDNTVAQFEQGLKQLIELVQDPKIDLEAKVPNGKGQIYLREFLLVIDHNSYHIGEFAIMRQVKNNWKK